MKKLASGVLAGMMALSLCACAGGNGGGWGGNSGGGGFEG